MLSSTLGAIKGKRVTVIGLGREGTALTRFLVARGAQVTVSDAKTEAELGPYLEQIRGLPVALSLGANRVEDAVQADLLCVSPGVPKDLPALQSARSQSIPITSETALFFALCPAPIVGVTGSAGKSTTTALLGEIFREAGHQTYVGGNIGVPLIERLAEITPECWVVLELSSFQLELLGQSPKVAIITNISPDHLDMHPSLEAYIEAKKNIVRFQGADDVALLNRDDRLLRQMAQACSGRVVWFGRGEAGAAEGVFWDSKSIVASLSGKTEPLMPTSEVRLPGQHNLSNVCAAGAAALACGMGTPAIRRAVANFRGLEHRLELVAEKGGVRYYDDSIATTPARTVAGLRAFGEPVVLLAGGRGKNLSFTELAPTVWERCRCVVLFGEAAPELQRALSPPVLPEGHLAQQPLLLRARSFGEAVALAQGAARPGDVVLLSPACTSFDLFSDYQERGREFQRLVRGLEAAQ